MLQLPENHPISDRKRAAARENGAKAKGTKTPEGIARSALNAVKHGITARTPFLLHMESQEEWNALQQSYFAALQPINRVERRLVNQLVLCDWRIHRAQELEAATLEQKLFDSQEQIDEEYESISFDFIVARAFAACDHVLARLSNYETRLQYQLRRTYRMLIEMQDRRGPIPPVQPVSEIVEPSPEGEPVPDGLAPETVQDDTQNEAKPGSAPAAEPELVVPALLREFFSTQGPAASRHIRRRQRASEPVPKPSVAIANVPEVAKAAS